MQTRILIVEDNREFRFLVARYLSKLGYTVIEAEDGLEGLRKAEQEKPDLIVLDIMLPGMDGYVVCRQIRQHPELAGTPVLMLTAKAAMGDEKTGFEVGADDYLTKPVDLSVLAERIQSLLFFSQMVG